MAGFWLICPWFFSPPLAAGNKLRQKKVFKVLRAFGIPQIKFVFH
jgi:hypothetical protein